MSVPKLKRIAVFCGASTGNKPEYTEATQQLVLALQEANIGLVYGGGRVGLMGKLADYAIAHKVEIIGVMPRALTENEVAHAGITKLYEVETMHERKALMTELADGFIMLPGGIGSLDEFFESWTWLQLGYHSKPCGILNVTHYFDPLIAFLDHATNAGFLGVTHRNAIIVEENPITLLQKFAAYQAPPSRISSLKARIAI